MSPNTLTDPDQIGPFGRAVEDAAIVLGAPPWKVALAAHLKATTGVSNRWLASQLGMGSHFYGCKPVGYLHRARNPDTIQFLRPLKVKGKA